MTMAKSKAAAPDGNYRIGESTIRNVRVEDSVWSAAGERAAADGTNLSALVRQWLGDYAETGSPLAAGGRRPKIRLTAAERKLAISELEEYFVPDRMLDAALDRVNYERG